MTSVHMLSLKMAQTTHLTLVLIYLSIFAEGRSEL